MMSKKMATTVAAVVAAVAAFSLVGVYLRGELETEAPPMETGSVPQTDLTVANGIRPEEWETTPVAGDADQAHGEDYAVAPCEGCLNERGALDVAEAYLSFVKPNHLGLRPQLYSDIPGDPTKQRLPYLPPGLKGAPAGYSVSDMVLPRVEHPEETWVVWVQVGWLDHKGLEARIDAGDFPPIARSWPPLKFEKYILVDARSGTVDTSGIYSLYVEVKKTRRDHPVDVFGGMAEDAAQQRADHWFGEARTRKANLGDRTGTPP